MDLESLPGELLELAEQLATGRYTTLADLIGEALRAHCAQEHSVECTGSGEEVAA